MTFATNTKTCQYIGPKRTQPGACCNTSMHAWASYCTEHFPIVYQEGTALRRRKKDIKVATNTFDLIAEFESVISELTLEGFFD